MVQLNLRRVQVTVVSLKGRKIGSYPTNGIKLFAEIDSTVPPTEDPIAANPIARPRLFLNQ